jgi:hypothetical protein
VLFLLTLPAVLTLHAFAAVTITVSPTSASMVGGQKKTFTATVQGASNTGVTWQVNDVTGGTAADGTITTSGVYAAPAVIGTQRVVVIKAISKADTSKSASSPVTLKPVTITISPTSAALIANATRQFSAKVQNASTSSVAWQVNGVTSGNSTVGTISSSGNYQAPSTIASTTVVTVTAISKADPTKTASAQVTLTTAVSISVNISPTTASLRAAATQQFTATVQNSSNTSVTWRVNGVQGGNSTVGTISSSGSYKAPSKIASLTVVTVTAVSSADTSKSAAAAVTLNPVVVGISPPSVIIVAGTQQQFTATVENSSNTSVTWLVNGTSGGNAIIGTISSSGLYRAPSTVTSQLTVTVTARSQFDTTKTASAPVTVNPPVPPVTVSLSPPGGTLIGGGTQLFTASVQNAANTNVSWYVNNLAGGDSTVGLIAPNGDGTALYTAPAKVASQLVVSVKAVSDADPSKSASVSVTTNPVTVSISPQSVNLAGGETRSFSATVQNAADPTYSWLVNDVPGGDATVGFITDAGAYTAPTVTSALTVLVKAVAHADETKSATASVTVNPVSISVSPGTAALGASGTQGFSALVQNTSNQSVTWSVTDSAGSSDPATAGTIAADGLYTAPAAISVVSTVTVKAISEADTSKSATAQVTLHPLTIAVSPDAVTLGAQATQVFAADVKYGSSTAVTWSVDSIPGGDINTVGSISDAGLYTAPSSILTSTTVTITATSVAETGRSGSVQLTLSPVVVSVSPEDATVEVSKTRQFTASVQYNDNHAVKWNINGVEGGDDTNGHISTAGLYTAPVVVPAPASITVTAVSEVDPNQSDSTQLTITGVTGNAYYVATNGNDTAAGTLTAPWKTISRAASASSGVKAGDTVYVRGGIYKESVSFAISGSAGGGPITFQNYPGETAIIDGTGIAAQSDPHGLVHIVNRTYITVRGFEIRNYQTSSSSLIPAGIWISGTSGNIQILNNLVHDIKTSSEASGQAYGISVYGTANTPIDTVTIDGNQVYNLKTGGSESVNVDGNVTNFVITNNIVHDNDNIAIDAIGFEGVSSNAAQDYARNGIISGNTIYNISGINNPGESNEYNADGIYVDGGSQILIERNLIHHVDIGIEAAAEHRGKNSTYITIRNNVIYATNSMGITIGGYDSRRGGVDHCVIVNNTLYGNDTKNTGSGEFQIQYYATNNVFKNNVIYGTSQGLLINSYTNSSANPVDSDYNLYFSPLAATGAEFVWNGTTRTGFAAYQSATGKDAHSQYLNPLFVNVPGFDFHVQPTSPAVDTGIDLTADVNGSTDLGGNPRVQGANIDKGAYEQ